MIPAGFTWGDFEFCASCSHLEEVQILGEVSYLGSGAFADCTSLKRITIPESLNYTGLFDDVMDIYTTYNCLTRVRTTGMGTMYELSYRLKFKRGMNEKAFIDELRCRNGNLDIMLGIVQGERGEM